MKRLYFLFIYFFLSLQTFAQQDIDSIGTLYATRQTPVHDPVMIKEKGTYYLFCTGYGISVFSSKDMKTWRKEKPVFATPPQWAIEKVPGYNGHNWAPDISYHNGLFYLYYSVSAFGKNTSCIGVAVNKTLNPTSPDFGWKDLGKVIQSVPGRDDWNAIDPNLIVDDKKNPWLSFGSFWSGIKIFKLDSTFTRPAEPPMWHSIAAKPRTPVVIDSSAGNGAIEAPFIFKKGKYYYLFVSWDYCCRGEKSNYKVVIGRSETVTGPYLDKTGKPMQKNGGSLFIEGDTKEWFGIGHSAVFTDDNGIDYFIAHGYDGLDNGRPKLIIKKLNWNKEGWPVVN